MGVGPGRLRRGSDDLHAGGCEDRVERGGELGVPVVEQKSQVIGAFVEGHQQVAGLLGDPGTGGVGGAAGDVDLPGSQFQEEQYVQSLEEHGIDGEEVTCHDGAGLGGEELGPGRAGPAGCGVDPRLVQDLPDRAGCEVLAEPEQFAV
jgi:hypothetical protein